MNHDYLLQIIDLKISKLIKKFLSNLKSRFNVNNLKIIYRSNWLFYLKIFFSREDNLKVNLIYCLIVNKIHIKIKLNSLIKI